MLDWNLQNTYADLPPRFHQRVVLTPVRDPRTVVWNRELATSLGLATADAPPPAPDIFAGNELPPGSVPIAQAYAGHQFGGFTRLGDGRAVLLGEQMTPSGDCFDIQLKGSGPTAYSRSGDGRAVLGPMLREYVISEAIAALGIPTTRSLAVVATGEPVYRPEPRLGAVLTRVAASHLRVGTFELFAATDDVDGLRTLADYAIARHDPHLVDRPDRYINFLGAVIARQAKLIARWMLVGFVHGVMNTDNVSIAGETIDYGPCAFIDRYDPSTTFSSIDRQGRYAYGNQPVIGHWNVARLAEAMLPLLDPDANRAIELATEAVQKFSGLYDEAYRTGMLPKLGLKTSQPGDDELISELRDSMLAASADWTNTFRDLSEGRVESIDPSWLDRWTKRLGDEGQPPQTAASLMKRHNPSVIPRNETVEASLQAAEAGDLQPFETLLAQLAKPYESVPVDHPLRQVPDARAPRYRTYCGT